MSNTTDQIKLSLNGKTFFLICVTVAGMFIGLGTSMNLFVLSGILILIILTFMCFWRPFLGLSFLLLLLPFHTMSMKILENLFVLEPRGIFFISVWKEVIIILLLFVVITKVLLKGNFSTSLTGKMMIWFCCLGIVYIFIARNFLAGVYGFRNLYEGFIIFFVTSKLSYSKGQLRKLLNLMIFGAVILTAWGLWQALFLGPDFLYRIGYTFGEKTLPSTFFIAGSSRQRVTSFFSGPNTMGVYLVMMIFTATVLFSSTKKAIHKMWYIVALGLMIIGLLYTFSRSAWLGLIFGGAVMGTQIGKRRRNLVVGITIFVILLFLLMSEPLGVFSYISRTITLQDPSAKGHWASLDQSVRFGFQYPFGIGLGMAGPKSSRFFDAILNAESSYFLVLFQMGYLGFFLFLLIFLSFWKESKSISKKLQGKDLSDLLVAIQAIVISVLTTFFFLPLVQEIEISIFLCFFLGILVKMRDWINEY